MSTVAKLLWIKNTAREQFLWIMSYIESKITAPEQNYIDEDLNFKNDVSHSKTVY